jgi:mono/diheme cytochrome c family protein
MRNLSWLWLVMFAPTAPAAPVDYTRDVKPVLTKYCVQCHGPTKQKAGLRVDTAAALRTGGNTGPALVAGKAADSLLLHALTGSNDVALMPPQAPKPTVAEIATIRAWIEQGAVAPANEASQQSGPTNSTHWAFQPLRTTPPPTLPAVDAGRHPIDAFILHTLASRKLTPAPAADKLTLIRRLSLDVIGLPPTPAEVDEFVNDRRPDAYERLVERLLASPHYGERWARQWLDLARYADSHGYSIDAPRVMWPYRDWVIHALNSDLPFDRFTIEQLAGDLLPNATLANKIATGFHRNTPINMEGGINVEQFRVEAVVDRVNTTGSVWLGLTVGCAQCHDHKYDPISQREYYQLFAFFNNCDEPALDLVPPALAKPREAVRGRIAALDQELKLFDAVSDERLTRWESGLTDETRAALPDAVQKILLVAINGRTVKQTETLRNVVRTQDKLRTVVAGLGGASSWRSAAVGHLLTKRTQLELDLAAAKKAEPQVASTLVVAERAKPRETYIMLGGDFLRKGVTVTTGTLAVLPPPAAKKTRLDLAHWLVDRNNPLTARVTMNRIWQVYFGTGLVETENDFGTQGTAPTHPELLDWLARAFMDSGWSQKALHRLIVTSATYRQSARVRPELATLDPRNRWLARQSRLRLDAELVRDAALRASGLFNPTIGGPSVFPPQPAGVSQFTQVKRPWPTSTGAERYRRGLYTHFQRSAPYPALTVFDAPNAASSCTRRPRSNTPLQALTLLNDTAFYEFAQALGQRTQAEPGDDGAKLTYLFRCCLSRAPTASERERLQAFLTQQRQGGTEAGAWAAVGRVVLNVDEFITRE